MDVLQKLNFRIDNANAVSLSGRQFNVKRGRESRVLNCRSVKHFDERRDLKVMQLALCRRPWTPSDTATLYEVENGSRNTFNYFCCVNSTKAELEGCVRINMLQESVKSGRNSDFRPKIRTETGKILWSGKINATALNNKVNKDRELIDKDFYKALITKSNFKEEMKDKLKCMLLKFRHIFSRDETDIGLYIDEEVDVRLKDENVHPPYIKARPIPHAAKEFVRDKVRQLTVQGVFEEVRKGSAYNSPAHIVMQKRPDGTTKF